MDVVECLAVLSLHIAEDVVLQVADLVLAVLALHEFCLLEEALDDVDTQVPSHVACCHVYVLVLFDPFDVEACHCVPFNTFVRQNFDFLLRVVEQPNRAIRAPNSKDVLESSNRIRNSLSNLDVPVETICNVLEEFHVHQAATGC